jgi:putative membrane protein
MSVGDERGQAAARGPEGRRAVPFLQNWAVSTVSVLVASQLVSGISYDSWVGLVLASLLLGILYALVRPILLLLVLPLVLVTLGLFTLVINALVFYFVGYLLPSFHVRDFRAAFWGALVVTLMTMVLRVSLGLSGAPVQGSATITRTRGQVMQGPDRGRSSSDKDGPVIDV